jgi:glycosyltransferase involved in cell wall biosynthesis
MKKLAFLVLLYSFSLFGRESPQPEFAIVIPSYNNEAYVTGNLDSAFSQEWPSYKVYYINDCSTDRTKELVEDYIKNHHLENKSVIIHNKERKGGLANFYTLIHSLNPKVIVVCLDGDDRLSSPSVLETLGAIYKDPDVWLTYGNYDAQPIKHNSLCAPIPNHVAKHRSFRKYKWVTTHLKTFRSKLFQLIEKGDFMRDGEFFRTSSDMAMMFPMLEMASQGHFRFIPECLYIYNDINPLQVSRVKLRQQEKNERLIRSRPPYEALETLY